MLLIHLLSTKMLQMSSIAMCPLCCFLLKLMDLLCILESLFLSVPVFWQHIWVAYTFSKLCQIFLQTIWFIVVLAFAMAIATDIASAYISFFRKLLGNSDGWNACFFSNAFVLLLGVSVLRSFKIFCLFYFFHFSQVQKQPPEVFYSKRCS